MAASHRVKGRRSTPPARPNQLSDVKDAALTLFAERGYRGTGIRDIAEALGIGTTSVYSHVSSKQDLLRDIVLETCADLLQAQADAIGSTDDMVEQLRRVAEAHVRLVARSRREALVTTEDFTAVEEPWLSEVLSMRRRYQQTVQEILERGQSQGRFDVDEPKLASFAIIEMCESVARWFRDSGPRSESRVAYAYGNFAVRLAGFRT
jgi:AcrR family transcriptional regulator